MPSPSCQRILIRSPLRPRKTIEIAGVRIAASGLPAPAAPGPFMPLAACRWRRRRSRPARRREPGSRPPLENVEETRQATPSKSGPTMTRRPFASAISMRPAAVGAGLTSADEPLSTSTGSQAMKAGKNVAAVSAAGEADPILPAPCEQLRRRQSVPPRCRRNAPRPLEALGDDPPLLLFRPAPARAGRDHFEPGNLRHRRMTRHTPMSSPLELVRKAALGGGLRLSGQKNSLVAATGAPSLGIAHRSSAPCPARARRLSASSAA